MVNRKALILFTALAAGTAHAGEQERNAAQTLAHAAKASASGLFANGELPEWMKRTDIEVDLLNGSKPS